MILLFWLITGCLSLVAVGIVIERPISKTILGLMTFLPVIAISLYLHWGNYSQWTQWVESQALPKDLPSPNKMIVMLQQHLEENPHSAQGWYLLGRLYASQQQFTDAADAFGKANQLKPGQIETELNLAEALFMQQNPQLYAEIQSLLTAVMRLDPNNDTATNLLALIAYQQGNYQQAISIWENLSEKYPADTDTGQAILRAIAAAQAKLYQQNHKA